MLTPEQKESRKFGIGASDSSIIMGYSSYKTPYELYLEKTGMVNNDDEETEQQYWGNALEPLIIARFAKENSVEVSFPDTAHHPDYSYILANLDGFIASENAVVEAKNVNSFQKKEWDARKEDGIPLVYLIQIAKQVAVVNADRGYCAVLVGGSEYMQFVYERDRALEELIIQSDIDFWHCVQNRIEPDPINTSDCRLKYRTPNPNKVAQSTFKTENAFKRLTNLKQDLKRLAVQEEDYKMAIMSHMGNAEYLVGQDGEIMASWKANKKGTRVFNMK